MPVRPPLFVKSPFLPLALTSSLFTIHYSLFTIHSPRPPVILNRAAVKNPVNRRSAHITGRYPSIRMTADNIKYKPQTERFGAFSLSKNPGFN